MSYLTATAKSNSPKTALTPQTSPIPGRTDMIQNAAGGFTFESSLQDQLMRFLILGTESSTYYESSDDLTKRNVEVVQKALDSDYVGTLKLVEQVSVEGRCMKNDTCIYVLAVASVNWNKKTSSSFFSDVLNSVCRTGTHILMFVAMADALRGWGTGFKNIVWSWYNNQEGKLEYQLAKYRNRNGWTHKDVFRQIHKPTAEMSPEMARLIGYVASKNRPETSKNSSVLVPPTGGYFEFMERAASLTSDGKAMAKLISEYRGVAWEMIPTEALNHREVWEVLVQRMPYTATLRNLAKMTSIGLITTFSDVEKLVIARLESGDEIKNAKVHPVSILTAQRTYKNGKGIKGSLTWEPSTRVVAALEDAFYASFAYVEPTGKNFVLGLDISGSMTQGEINGVPGLTPIEAEAAIAMTLVRSEKNVLIGGFSSSGFRLIDVTKNDRLESAAQKVHGDGHYGGTDCAIPVRYAKEKKIPADCFIVMTDNETYAGPSHAAQELRDFRKSVNSKAKMVMAAFTATPNSIADAKDPLSLALVGMDSNLPKLIQEFARL